MKILQSSFDIFRKLANCDFYEICELNHRHIPCFVLLIDKKETGYISLFVSLRKNVKNLTLHKKERQQQDHSFRSNQSVILFIHLTGKNGPTQKRRVRTSSSMLIQLSLTFRLSRQDSMLKF